MLFAAFPTYLYALILVGAVMVFFMFKGVVTAFHNPTFALQTAVQDMKVGGTLYVNGKSLNGFTYLQNHSIDFMYNPCDDTGEILKCISSHSSFSIYMSGNAISKVVFPHQTVDGNDITFEMKSACCAMILAVTQAVEKQRKEWECRLH